MKVRFLFFTFAMTAVLALAAIGAALWILTTSYGDLGEGLEQRKRHFPASADLMRLTRPVAPAEMDAARADAEAVQKRWQEAGASAEELALLRDALEARLQLPQIADRGGQGVSNPGQKEWMVGGVSQTASALTQSAGPETDVFHAELVSKVNRLVEMADARTRRGVDSALHELGTAVGIAIAAVALLLVVGIAAAVLLNATMLRPMRRLAHDIEGISKRNETTPLEARTRVAELQKIADAFNALSRVLEDEVRARMRMAVEVQRARTAADSAARARDALQARLHEQQPAKVPQPEVAPLDLRERASRRNQNV